MKELQKKNEKAFVTYMTAGLPDMEGTKALIKAQEEAGIDIIELGIPFSDPTADGPVSKTPLPFYLQRNELKRRIYCRRRSEKRM